MMIGDVEIIGLTKTVCEGFQRKVLIKVENHSSFSPAVALKGHHQRSRGHRPRMGRQKARPYSC